MDADESVSVQTTREFGVASPAMRANEFGDVRAGIRLRPGRLADLWSLWTLQRRCFAGGQAYGVATWLALYIWPPAQILVAEQGERLVGCVVGDVRGDRSRILNICVDPDFRRQGLGWRLLEAAEERLGASDVTLMVEDKNLGARELYQRAGYLPVGDLRHYYGRNRHGILMQKRRG